jgi:hypothetical protein
MYDQDIDKFQTPLRKLHDYIETAYRLGAKEINPVELMSFIKHFYEYEYLQIKLAHMGGRDFEADSDTDHSLGFELTAMEYINEHYKRNN